jgi:hypothetical protein
VGESSKQSDKSTLVVVLPETRSFELTFDSFRKNLLEVVDGDLCLCVKNDPREVLDNPFYQHAKHTFVYPEPLDWLDETRWGDAFDYAQGVEGVSEDWRKLLTIENLWLGRGRTEDGVLKCFSPTITIFFRWFLREKLLAEGLLEKYEWFVITRSDFLYRIPHIPLTMLDPNYVWIPDGEDYGGLTDRHMVVSRKFLEKALSAADPIIRSPDELYEQMRGKSDWNVEMYLQLALGKVGLLAFVKRFPYTMYTVRDDSTHTSWSKGIKNRKDGYLVKYLSEYNNYYMASLYIKKVEDWNLRNVNKAMGLISVDRRVMNYIRKPTSSKRLRYIKRDRIMPIWLKTWHWTMEGGLKERIGRGAFYLFVLYAKIFNLLTGRSRKSFL